MDRSGRSVPILDCGFRIWDWKRKSEVVLINRDELTKQVLRRRRRIVTSPWSLARLRAYRVAEESHVFSKAAANPSFVVCQPKVQGCSMYM
jgi:hypothetical protein